MVPRSSTSIVVLLSVDILIFSLRGTPCLIRYLGVLVEEVVHLRRVVVEVNEDIGVVEPIVPLAQVHAVLALAC